MTQDTPEHDRDDVALAGEYTLGLLSEAEAAAFEARLVAEPDLRALYADWAEALVRMTNGLDEVPPPAALKARVDARLFGVPERRGFWARLGVGDMMGGLVAAALALLLIVSPMLRDLGPQPPANPIYHADIAAEDGSLLIAAGYDAETGELYVERRAGQALPGRVLELWLIAGDNPPVSLGVLPEDTRTRLPVAETLRAALNGGVLAISDEPPGGSPTGLPTGAVLAVGPVGRV